MSLYRQAGRASGRTVLIAAAAALVVGLLAGVPLGRSTAPKPSLADKVADLRASLAPAREGLELAATEYGQAVRSGRVVGTTEDGAAKAEGQSSRGRGTGRQSRTSSARRTRSRRTRPTSARSTPPAPPPSTARWRCSATR